MGDQALDLGDGFSHDCPPSHAGKGDVACDVCGTAWRWVQEDEQRGYWRELTPGELLGERDRARDAAVALEQELALKDEALDQIRALHVKGREVVVFRSAYNVCAGCEQPWRCRTQRVLSSLASRLEDHDHTCCACFTHNNLPCCNEGHPNG